MNTTSPTWPILFRIAAIGILAAGVSLGCGDSLSPPADPTPERTVQGTAPTTPNDTGKSPTPAEGNPGQEDKTAGAGKSAVLPPDPPFKGWPQPEVALLITGQQLGYIEPCGCTGLENQKGGLARRHTLIRQLQDERGWAVVPLDVGSQVRRYGRQQEIKFQHTANALRTLGYQAVAFGADDLRLPAGELLSGTNVSDDIPSIFTSANVALISRELTPQFHVVETGGKKIGVVAVLGDAFERKLEGGDLVHEAAIAGLKQSCVKLKEQGCDYYVLLAHAPLEESQKIAQEMSLFDLVVTSGGGGLPSTALEAIDGTKAKLLKVSHKAMHVGVVGIFDDRESPIRYQAVALDATLQDSPEMLQLLADYQEQLRSEGLAGLGLKPQPLPGNAKFVGSETCGECHTKAMEIWKNTPHAHATDSLVTPPNSRGSIARHFDPECLSCHVTGWEPLKFFPFESGYVSLEATKHLQHNGCENCHGPGSAHVAAENGSDAALQAKLREAMKLPIAGGKAEAKCRECHDEDNSPDFSHRGFAAYWKEVEHQGKD